MRRILIYCLILFAPLALFAEQVPDSHSATHAERKEFAYANDPSYWQAEKPKKIILHSTVYLCFSPPAMYEMDRVYCIRYNYTDHYL